MLDWFLLIWGISVATQLNASIFRALMVIYMQGSFILFMMLYLQVRLVPLAQVVAQNLDCTGRSNTPTSPSYARSARDRLDDEIDRIIAALPGLITEASQTIKEEIMMRKVKIESMGSSIVAGGFTEATGGWVFNGLGPIDAQDFVTYGFYISYGFGFGLPLILGQEKPFRTCGTDDLERLLDKYGLGDGINKYYRETFDCRDMAMAAQIKEFELFLRDRLYCILSFEEKFIEAAEVKWAIDELISALDIRNEWETAAEEQCRKERTQGQVKE